jgi:hypothetical protein
MTCYLTFQFSFTTKLIGAGVLVVFVCVLDVDEGRSWWAGHFIFMYFRTTLYLTCTKYSLQFYSIQANALIVVTPY